MSERVILPEKIGPYEIGEHLDSGWGWDVYSGYVQAGDHQEARACHLRVFFNQPNGGHLHTHLIEARNKISEHPHLHVQRIRHVEHIELSGRISGILVEEELLKEWSAPKPSDYKAIMLQLLSAVEHLKKIGLPGIGLSKANLARSRAGKAVLASLSPNWEQLWAGRSRAGEAEYYLRLPPESAESPGEFEGPQWVWSAGSLLLEALAGTFSTPTSLTDEDDVFDTPISTYVNHQLDDSRESFLSRLPEDIQSVLRRALAAKPEDRFATLAKFSEALETPIQTGKPGDRYVMPTSSAVQDVSPPPKNTFWGYALGIMAFVIFMGLVFWFVVITPSRQKGATLSGSGPGFIIEPDTDWRLDGETAETPVTQQVQSEAEKPLPEAQPKPEEPGLSEEETVEVFLPSKTPALIAPKDVPHVGPDPVDQPAAQIKGGETELAAAPSPTEPIAEDLVQSSEEELPAVETETAGEEVVPPAEAQAAEIEEVDTRKGTPAGSDTVETLLSNSADWDDISKALSQLSWDELGLQDRKRLLNQVPEWAVRHQTMIEETKDRSSRSLTLNKIEAFWALGHEEIRAVPEAAALLEDIEQCRSTLRIQVSNQTGSAVSILDNRGKRLSSINPGVSSVFEIPSGSKSVSIRAQGEHPWMYTDKSFQSDPGGFFSWEFTNLNSHPAIVIPELPGPNEDIQVEYSKSGSSETLPLRGEIRVLPGDYSFTFFRPDYYPVRKVLRFSLPARRYKVSLPSKEKWAPKKDLQQLLSWESRLAEEPHRVAEEMKANGLPDLESEIHKARLSLLQTSLREKIISHQVEVEFVGGDSLNPPARMEVKDLNGNPAVKEMAEKIKLSPGTYRVIFRRGDYEPIENDWLVLPKPKKIKLECPPGPDWQPVVSLEKLRRLEKDLQSSGSRETVQIIQELQNTEFEWPEHEALYKRLRKEWYRQAAGL